MREFFGGVDGEFVFVFFAAVGTEEAAILPFGEAEAAEEESLAAIEFGAEDGGDGFFGAERAARLDAGGRGIAAGARGGVGLQEDAGEEGVHRIGATQEVVPGESGRGRPAPWGRGRCGG